MNQRQRLEAWVNTLTDQQIKDTLIRCVEDMILTEDLRFWHDSEYPYCPHSGERIDGIER